MIKILPRLDHGRFVAEPTERVMLILKGGLAAGGGHCVWSRLGEEGAEIALEKNLHEQVFEADVMI